MFIFCIQLLHVDPFSHNYFLQNCSWIRRCTVARPLSKLLIMELEISPYSGSKGYTKLQNVKPTNKGNALIIFDRSPLNQMKELGYGNRHREIEQEIR